MYLGELKPGQSGTITSLAELDAPVRRKLMAMGLLPHSEVRLLRAAPLGDPLQISTTGITLSIQKKLAMQIEVVDL